MTPHLAGVDKVKECQESKRPCEESDSVPKKNGHSVKSFSEIFCDYNGLTS